MQNAVASAQEAARLANEETEAQRKASRMEVKAAHEQFVFMNNELEESKKEVKILEDRAQEVAKSHAEHQRELLNASQASLAGNITLNLLRHPNTCKSRDPRDAVALLVQRADEHNLIAIIQWHDRYHNKQRTTPSPVLMYCFIFPCRFFLSCTGACQRRYFLIFCTLKTLI